LNWTVSTKVAQCNFFFCSLEQKISFRKHLLIKFEGSDQGLSACKEIEHCKTVVCFKPSSGDLTSACRMCDKGYYGSSWEATNSTGSEVCTKGMGIGNCELTRQVGASSHICYACEKNYTVDFDQTGCIAWTIDSNCRRLQTGNKDCYYCWHSYFWASNVCKLGSYLMGCMGIVVGGILTFFAGA
jgi:hypothetical protein